LLRIASWAGLLILLVPGLCCADSLTDAMRAGQYDEALRLADALVKSNPRSPAVWTARGYALEGLRRDEDSIGSFQKALAYAPHFAPALKGAAEVAYRARDPRALSFVDELLRLEPDNKTALGMGGVLEYEAGNCRLAIRHFEQSGPEALQNEEVSSMYGVCLMREHRASDAEAVLDRLVTARPDSALSLNLLARAEASNGHLQPAVDHLRKAIEIDPQKEQNYIDLVSLYIQYGTWEIARDIIETSLRQNPDSPRLHALRGVIDAQFGKYEEAASELERANDLDPANKFGAAGLGVLYAERNDPQSAATALRARLQKIPDDPTLNYLLADALVRQGQDDASARAEARASLEKAVRAQPDFERAHALLGKIYVQSGSYGQAIHELQLALKQNAQDRMALNQLVIAFRHMGRDQDAANALSELKRVVANQLQTDKQSVQAGRQ
jgi:predicted Zn-dependent protease